MNDRLERVVYRTRGGLLAWSELRLLAEAASAHSTGRLYATPHQEMVLRGVGFGQAKRLLGQPPESVLQPWGHTRTVNVVTTAPVAGLDGTTPWLSDGGVRDILGSLTLASSRSIAFGDPMQNYLPIFLAEITFLAMAERDHWRVRVAPAGGMDEWLLPGAIRSRDIPEAVRLLDLQLHDNHDGGDAARALADALEPYRIETASFAIHNPTRYRPAPQTLTIPIPEDGLRSDFCLDLCVWAMRRSGVSVGLTPWRTLIARGLSNSDLLELKALMLRRNVVEDSGPWRPFFMDGLIGTSGEWLHRALNERCAVDMGMAIGIVPWSASMPDVHVLVREKKPPRLAFRGPRYDVYRRESGGTRSGAWVRVATNLRKRDVPDATLGAVNAIVNPAIETPAASADDVGSATVNSAHRCCTCLTEYDERFGDPGASIGPGVAFEALPFSWTCPVCSGPKDTYERVYAV